MTDNNVIWTALPNGIDDSGKVRITVLATLRLHGGDSDTLADRDYAAFRIWPQTLIDLAEQNFKWEVNFTGETTKHCPLDTVLLDAEIWQALFRSGLPVRPRTGASRYQNADVSSYDAQHLNDKHLQHRASLAINQLLTSNRITPQSVPALLSQRLDERLREMNLLLHPGVGGAAGVRENDIYRAQIESQISARAFVDNIKSRDPILAARLTRDLARLERGPGARVRAEVLLALVDHHAKQLVPPNTQVAADFAAELDKSCYRDAEITLAEINSATSLLKFALFHQRPEHIPNDVSAEGEPECEYDFHKLLTIVGQFPVLLRILGLAFDIVVDAPALPKGTVSVSLQLPARVVWKTLSLQTSFEYKRDASFIAEAKPAGLLRGRMLNVDCGDFSLVVEDIDGTNLKDMLHAEATERAREYRSGASPQDDDRQIWPSTRSAGISLLYTKREHRLKEAISKTSMTQLLSDATENRTSTPPLYADDLILGYRVDIWDNQSEKWHSLCERTATYDFFDEPEGSKLRSWTAPKQLQNLEEGFIQLAVTVPSDSEDGDEQQLQVHQSIFCWTGWSLSVEPPVRPLNPSHPPTEDDQPLRMKPKFSVKPCSLPPLRIGVGYKVRCRMVDLAGNSLPPMESDLYNPTLGDGSEPLVYDRWDPVRSPAILLQKAIDPRQQSPGEQMDRLVIHDSDGDSVRIAVPPRVPQHLAELHGKLDNDLPDGAFPNVELQDDGSFPSFAGDRVVDQNAHFHYNRNYKRRPNCGYFPDPLVQQMRIQAFLLNDRGKVPDSPAFELLIPFFPNDLHSWPNASPVRLHLEDAPGHVSASQPPLVPNWDWGLLDDEDSHSPLVPSLRLRLRQAESIELSISSVLPKQIENGKKLGAVQNCLALVRCTNGELSAEGLGTLSSTELEAFIDGTHPMICPPHQLMAVHAVKRPLLVPKFGESFQIQRSTPGDPSADVAGDISIDWFSTAQVTCTAVWTDCIDDLTKPGPVETQTSELAFDINANEADRRPASKHHRFRDTHFHEVDYSLVATSRFREYYPEGSDPGKQGEFQVDSRNVSPDKQHQKGYVLHQLIKNSARPSVPSVAYIIPSFQWQKGYNREKHIDRHARIAALRVYLNRPWCSSGKNERLGVLYSPLSAPDPKLQDFISRWGVDPIWKGGVLPEWLEKEHFCGYLDSSAGCSLKEFEQISATPKPTADVVGYEAHYDDERRMWFSDIQVNPQIAYYPFIRLALVRFQPCSLDDARISPVLVSDFAQIAPNRWAHIQKLDHHNVLLCISGVTYESGTGASDSGRFHVSVQQRWHEVGKEMGWVTTDGPFSDFTVTSTNGVTMWQRKITLHHSTSFFKYRLLIEECESISGDAFDGNGNRLLDSTRSVARLVYADLFEL